MEFATGGHVTKSPPATASNPGWSFLFAAWIVALVSSLSAIFIGEIMGQTPCVLCWHQRAFMFPLAFVLAVGCYLADAKAWSYALPLASIGWLIAAYHVLLYVGVIPAAIVPCSAGPSCSSSDMTVFGVIPIPVLSLAAFSAIIALSLLARRRYAT